MGKRNKTMPLEAPLEAWVPHLAKCMGCSVDVARKALADMVRVGLVAVDGEALVLPLAPTTREMQSDMHGR